jgi:hypothetical protein
VTLPGTEAVPARKKRQTMSLAEMQRRALEKQKSEGSWLRRQRVL